MASQITHLVLYGSVAAVLAFTLQNRRMSVWNRLVFSAAVLAAVAIILVTAVGHLPLYGCSPSSSWCPTCATIAGLLITWLTCLACFVLALNEYGNALPKAPYGFLGE
ncbi:hypothetical protein F4778DRAFT_729154 [Xylariomycetidae sp. FL2044]|nr:hypothetical protein F4778DRAFT_729154 [Xylariomycetidae sp. FL2044]